MADIAWYDVKPPARRRIGARPLLTALLVVLISVTALSTAWAFWTAGAVAGANGAAAAVTVDRGASPTASVLGQSVTLDWAASTLSTGQAVDGYLITRYDAATEAPQTVVSDCAGTVAATTCTENSVPAGTWTYAVTPVFATSWQGDESPPSSDVTVLPPDPTPPTNAISLSDVTGDAVMSGDTVFYRGSAAGSFTLTNAVADAGSGPDSSTTAELGGTTTGWTHTPSTVSTPSGGPYVSGVFQWDAGTTSSPSEVVTGRDVAGNTAAATLTFVDDSTPPGPGTISYDDGYTPGRFVTVTFTTAADDGSGIATRRLQRAEAPLTDGTCGTFGAFTNLGPADPTSPHTDSAVANGSCYRYQYVVTDRVGNQDVATSANTAKVDYAGAVATTAGVLSHWRLGDDGAPPATLDSFTGTSGALVSSRTGEVGATWTHRFGNTSVISDAGRARRNGSGYSIYDASGTPPSADYAVEADFHYRGALTNDALGILGRWDPASISYYMVRYEQQYQSWTIYKAVNNVQTYFAGWVGDQPLTVGQTYRVRLEMSGSTTTTIRMFVNGVQMGATATDTTNPVTAAGRAGFWDGMNTGGPAITKTNNVGLHLDNFQVTPLTYPRATDSVGSNIASYVNGPTLATAGAIPGDADTAATFDGVNDHVQAVATTGIPTGAGLRSVEAWFKTSSAARQVLFSYGSPAASQEFGLWLDAGGATMTAWGFGSGQDKTFTLPGAVNDGQWHHVVKTYDGSSLTIYIDGVALPPQAAVRNTVMDAYGFGIGAVIRAGDTNSGGFFVGSIDEVSFYTSVLDQTTVTSHHQLGTAPPADLTGPAGGSVQAAGLVGTGSRYSTSPSLSIELDAGTDPAGLAGSGAELWRATATLTSAAGTADGVCGAFGLYTLVATDPVSPRADTVTDQACYSYQYVVADTLGNATTYTSPEVRVDTTAPTAPGLSFAGFDSTYWSGTGTTLHYRPTAASGGFTATASATDTASGITAYTFPALGPGWTSTPGALGVHTYSWSGSPASPGTVGVSATNHSTLTSAMGTFTLTEDTTAPTAGTVTHSDGVQTSTTVSVSFTTGTDAGSGIGTRLLQRAAAPLTDTTCGTYGAFATVADGTNPTSPLADTVAAGACYRYQYVVADNVGNQHVASGSDVVMVASSISYSQSILSTSGLLNYYRLGETAISSDTFTGTAGATLQSRSGEVGATWTRHANADVDIVLTDAGRVRKAGTNSWGAVYYASAIPASANYLVEADVYVASAVSNDTVGVVGRLETANAEGTYYMARYEMANGDWTLYRRLNGSWGWIGGYTQALTTGTTYRLGLDMNGSTIRLLVDGVQRVSVTDTAITAAGRGGVNAGRGSTQTTVSDTTGMHLDNFAMTAPPMVDSKNSNNGVYVDGVTLGVAGALAGDADTAVQFDGINDHTSVARQIADDFSIEFWFSSTQGIGTDARWTQGAGLVDANVSGSNNDFGVALRSDGRVVAGVGGGAGDTSVVSSSSGHNDGFWHHVVFTRTRSTGAFILYVDGVAVGSASNNTAALTASPTLTFGRAASGGNFFAGALDEVAIYTTVLSPETVSAHYAAGQ